MANPLPEENKFYEQIRNDGIAINPEIWDLLYHRIGDDITAINLLCQFYLTEEKPIPFQEAGKILKYTRHIKEIINELTSVVQNKGLVFPEFLENGPLHPILREMFTHYIGNDVYMINLIVWDSVDPKEPKDVPLDAAKKIIAHTRTIKEFMNRLREATAQRGEPAVTMKNQNSNGGERNNKNLTKEQVFLKIKEALVQEFRHLSEGEITPQMRFTEDMRLDSIDAIQVVMALEEAFGLEIPDSDAEGIFTVGQAAEYIYKRLKKGA